LSILFTFIFLSKFGIYRYLLDLANLIPNLVDYFEYIFGFFASPNHCELHDPKTIFAKFYDN